MRMNTVSDEDEQRLWWRWTPFKMRMNTVSDEDEQRLRW